MKGYSREIKDGIDSLVDEKGKFKFGTYNTHVKNINMLEAKRTLGFPAPKFIKRWRLKEWEAFQVGDEDIFIIGAVYNTKILAVNQFALYDKRNGKLYNYRKFCPSSKQVIASGLCDSVTKYESEDYNIVIKNNIETKKINVKVKISGKGKQPDIKMDIAGHHNTEPIVICQPFGKNRGLYSHKALMKIEGTLNIGDEVKKFNLNKSFAIVDDHKGYYPFTIKYDWVTGCINNEKKGLMGFNLTDNQVKNHEKYNENCLWMNGKMYTLPPVKFRREHEDKEVWIIKDNYEKIDIKFFPVAKLEVKFNGGIIYSDYEGPFGEFIGYIKDDNGEKIDLSNFFGMGEKKNYRV